MKLPIELQRPLAKLIAQTWIDDNFRNRLFSEPAAVLEEAGLSLQGSTRVSVNQGSGILAFASGEGGESAYEITIPPKPTDLSDELISSFYSGLSGFGNLETRGSCSS